MVTIYIHSFIVLWYLNVIHNFIIFRNLTFILFISKNFFPKAVTVFFILHENIFTWCIFKYHLNDPNLTIKINYSYQVDLSSRYDFYFYFNSIINWSLFLVESIVFQIKIVFIYGIFITIFINCLKVLMCLAIWIDQAY
jgi:hypothetical protein